MGRNVIFKQSRRNSGIQRLCRMKKYFIKYHGAIKIMNGSTNYILVWVSMPFQSVPT